MACVLGNRTWVEAALVQASGLMLCWVELVTHQMMMS